MNIVIRDLDQTRIKYGAMMNRVGKDNATLAFNRALNHSGRKTFTAVKRALREQTSANRSIISEATRFQSSTKRNLRTIIHARGGHLPLRVFKPKQFSFGVRVKVWGKWQRYKSAFIVASFAGNVFRREGKARLPIAKMFGPAIPREIVMDKAKDVFELSHQDLVARANHEIERILKI